MKWIQTFLFYQSLIFLECLGSRLVYFRLTSQIPNLEMMKSDMSPNFKMQNPRLMQAVSDLYKIAPFEPFLSPSVLTQNKKNFNDRLHLYYIINPKDIGNRTPKEIVKALKENALVDMAAEDPVLLPLDLNLIKHEVHNNDSIRNVSSVVGLENRNFSDLGRWATGEDYRRVLQNNSIPNYTDCDRNPNTCQKYMFGKVFPSFSVGGVNAFEAQRLSNHKGKYARIIVAETQLPYWDHIDLPSPDERISINDSLTDFHATASSGIMVGQDNGFGVLGIVPQALAGSIMLSIDKMRQILPNLLPGDIFQAGVQVRSIGVHCKGTKNGCLMPVEYLPVYADIFKHLAEEKGVHVIQAAGNGFVDLDHPGLNGQISLANDTGTIIAGAVDPVHGSMTDFSTYGSRVTFCSWGSHVTTTTKNEKGDGENLYMFTYRGTSSSNPIIAGCAAFLQSLATDKGIKLLSPRKLRQIMFDTGTEIPGFGSNKYSCRQPNLVKAVEYLESMTTTPTETATTISPTKLVTTTTISPTKLVTNTTISPTKLVTTKTISPTKLESTKTITPTKIGTTPTITTTTHAPRTSIEQNIRIGALIAGTLCLVAAVSYIAKIKWKNRKPQLIECIFEDELI